MKTVIFTGTRKGLTRSQIVNTRKMLSGLKEKFVFVHSDYIGGEAQMHRIVRAHFPKIAIRICRPTDTTYSAFCNSDIIYDKAGKYTRHLKKLLDNSDRLIACPAQEKNQQNSTTWATIRYARIQNLPIYIILPNGDIVC